MFVCLRVVLNSKFWTATFFPVGRYEETLRNETYTTDTGFLFCFDHREAQRQNYIWFNSITRAQGWQLLSFCIPTRLTNGAQLRRILKLQ